MAVERGERKLAAVLAADGVGYYRLMAEDEAGTRARINAHFHELIEPAVGRRRGGGIVRTTGDGVPVRFANAVDATECAIKIQHALARPNEDVPEGGRVEPRIGINLGDVIVVGDDIHGDNVNVAAPLEALRGAAEVDVPAVADDRVEGKIDMAFEGLAEHSVRNVSQPIGVCRVSSKPRPATPAARQVDKLFERPVVAVLPFEENGGDPDREFSVRTLRLSDRRGGKF